MSDSLETFQTRLAELLDIGDRQIRYSRPSLGNNRGSLFVNYYNLPEGIGGAGGGAEAENNRITLAIDDETVRSHYDPRVPEGKLRVKMSVSALPREHNLRGKTAAPEKLAEYVAKYLNKIAAEVPPHFTHTRMP